MTFLDWVAVAAQAWLVASVVVGVLIGRVVRNRDRQIPR